MSSAQATAGETLQARSEDDPVWLGATVDIVAVKRDAILAGVFAGANAFAGTMDWVWFVPGMLFGAVLGMVLHVLPAEPRAGDSRRGRIVIRGICGGIGGAWAGLGFAFVASGAAVGNAPDPVIGDLVPNLVVGALTGSAWYVIWGVWETRRLES
jgi:hypothetical protein